MPPRRIRVLLMASSMRGGGSEHQTALLARHLDRDAFEPHLFLSDATGDLLATLPDDVIVHADASPSPRGRWRVPGSASHAQADRFAGLVREHRIDVIYDRTFHMTMIAGHPSIRDRVPPRVSTIVSPPDVALPTVERRFVLLKRRRLAAAYRRSAGVIAVSTAAARSAERYYRLRENGVAVIRNPIDAAAVVASADRVPPPNDQRVLVCVGRMTVEKGQADLLAAIDQLRGHWPAGTPKLRVRLIGDGPDRAELRNRWAAAAVDDGSLDGHRVEFAGPRHPATPEIAAASGLILPSRFEGMPNVVLEAFALGVPVIATTGGGTAELSHFENAPAIYAASSGDARSLSEAILGWATDPEGWADRVAAGRSLLAANHTIGGAIDAISDRLRRAAAS